MSKCILYGRKSRRRCNPSRKKYGFDVSTASGQKRLMAISMGLDSETYISRPIQHRTGDTGADPMGDGAAWGMPGQFVWKMYPSGDIVNLAEREKRLHSRSNPRRRRNPATRKPGYVKPGYGIGDKATVQAVFRGSHFETNPYSVAAIKAVYGKRAARFDSFFMYPHSSGVTSVWGMKGVAPYNHNTVTMVGREMR